MKKLIAMPAFDENGVLNGIDLVARVYVPDEGINDMPDLLEIIFDVRDRDTEEIARLSLPSTESRISRARLFLRNNIPGHFVSKTTHTATSLR